MAGYYSNDKLRYRALNLKNQYGITLKEYSAKLAAQGNKCAICGDSNPGFGRSHFAVDHNHATGQVRGLLCQRCNSAIGYLRDNSLYAARAARYLNFYSLQRRLFK